MPDLADKGATQTSSDAKAIWTKYPPKSVHLASAQVYRHQGHHDAAFVVQEVAKDPANLGPKIRDFISNPRQGPLYIWMEHSPPVSFSQKYNLGTKLYIPNTMNI